MAGLVKGGSQLEIEGRRPRVAVIDTGASAIILGNTFALYMEKCRPEWLAFGDTFITARGTQETCLGQSKLLFYFVSAKGTNEFPFYNGSPIIQPQYI